MLQSLLIWLTERTASPQLAKWFGAFARGRGSRLFVPLFARLYGINRAEAAQPISSYPSLQAFFVRTLKPGARPISANPEVCISPVDGTVCAIETIDEHATFLVKGQRYTVASLLDDTEKARQFLGGIAVVIYLSPANYHRIHAPITATVTGYRPIHGAVYPVHDFSLRHVRQVLSRNRRVITYFTSTQYGTKMALVKVGAMNVGEIPYSQYGNRPPEHVNKGEDLAYFSFGSTVVCLWQADSCQLSPDCVIGRSIQMGQPLATMLPQKTVF